MSQSPSQYPYGGVAIFYDWHGIDFSINHVINTGAAWGRFATWQTALLIIRIFMILAVSYYLFSSSSKSNRLPFTLILSGAIGNVLDYFLYGHVVDMFHFRFWGYTYPLFNIADSAIVCGIICLLFLSFQRKLKSSFSKV
jgi:signal peptidase II